VPIGREDEPDIEAAGQRVHQGCDGRVGLYAGFCARLAVSWRPSISVCRRRQTPAAYPQASGGPPSIACAGRHPWVAALLALLRAGFTEPPRSPGVLVGSYPTVSPLPGRRVSPPPGGLLSVALSRGSPRVAVNNRPALWSPDVPRRHREPRHRRDRPANSSVAPPMIRISPSKTATAVA